MKNLILIVGILLLNGCVQVKYGIKPNGQQIQSGDYIDNYDFYMKSHWRCSKTGKEIIQYNKACEEWYKKNH